LNARVLASRIKAFEANRALIHSKVGSTGRL